MDSDKYIGRYLDNRYEILEVIGTGGMAVVYKARCHRLNRLVAIKILKDEYSKDDEFRRRFHAEGQAVAMLSHPNIVSVYDVSTSDDADYIVMELIDGITLKQYMEKKGILNWKETLHFAMQIAKALEHAHSRGIVHRDIKPHNVMVLKNGSVKVADFGIARIMSKGNTLTKEALGSVHYISPEQAKGGRVDNRSDIYSLGVVMYEMMAGRPPYDGESPVAVAIQHINGGAPMPSTLNPNIPGGLEQIIMKAMAHEPNNRYESASAMLFDMDEFRKDPTILFDYNLTGTPDIPIVAPTQPPRTTAERVVSRQSEPQRPRSTPGVERVTGRQSVPSANRPSAPRTTSGGSRSTSGGMRTAPQRSARPAQNRPRRESADDGRNRVALIAIIVCSVVVLLAIGIILFALFGNGFVGNHEERVQVPRLLGQDYQSIGTYNGITIELGLKAYSDDYARDQVMAQRPEPGTEVVKGTVVYVDVSLGKEPETKTMEDLVGMGQESAVNFLKSLEFVPKVREENSPTAAKGEVTRTEPAEGEPMEDGQVVTVWISTGKMTMPNVMGLDWDAAVSMLEENGFHNHRITETDSDQPKNTVVEQSVPARTDVDVNTAIVLKVSSGVVTKQMPNVVGRDLETAKQFLTSAGLTKWEIKEVESDQPKGTVVRQSENPNAMVDVEKTITLEVADGMAKMPDVLGKNIEQAKQALTAAGFTKWDIQTVESDQPKDTVVRQSENGGTRVDTTKTITLEVSGGPAAKPVSKTINVGLPEGMIEPYKFTIKQGSQVVYEQTVAPSQSMISVTFTGTGVQYYDVYINDVIQSMLGIRVDFSQP